MALEAVAAVAALIIVVAAAAAPPPPHVEVVVIEDASQPPLPGAIALASGLVDDVGDGQPLMMAPLKNKLIFNNCLISTCLSY